MVCALGPFVRSCLRLGPGWRVPHGQAASSVVLLGSGAGDGAGWRNDDDRRTGISEHGLQFAVHDAADYQTRCRIFRRLPAAVGTDDHPDDLVTDLPGFSVEGEQDAGSDALVYANECEQDVLGANVVMSKSLRLTLGLCEHPLRTGREGDFAGGNLLAGADDAHHLSAHTLDGDVQAFENPSGHTLLLAEKTEQDVHGADAFVLERPRLILGKGDRPTPSLC
jgi:hypothetical protein